MNSFLSSDLAADWGVFVLRILSGGIVDFKIASYYFYIGNFLFSDVVDEFQCTFNRASDIKPKIF